MDVSLLPKESSFSSLPSVKNSSSMAWNLRFLRYLLLKLFLAYQRHKPAAAGDSEFAEDCVKMLFYCRQTQAGFIGDLLVAPPIADKSYQFPSALRELDEIRQTGTRRSVGRSSLTAQIFALDKNMRP